MGTTSASSMTSNVKTQALAVGLTALVETLVSVVLVTLVTFLATFSEVLAGKEVVPKQRLRATILPLNFL